MSGNGASVERSQRRVSVYGALSFLLLIGWSGWLAYESLAFGRQSYSRKHDTSEQSTPYYLALGELAERGQLGYWHPQAAAGVDALANIKTEQPIVESLFRYFPHWSNSGVLQMGQSLLAAVGLFLLLRTLNVTYPAAVIGGAAFAFFYSDPVEIAGFATWHGLFLPGLPLWHLILRWAARRPPLAGSLVATAGGVCLGLGSLASLGVLTIPMVAISLWALEPALTRRHFILFGVFCAAYLVIDGRTLAALATLAPESHRMLLPEVQQTVSDPLAARAAYRDAAIVLLQQHALLLACAITGWLLDEFRSRALTVSLLICAVLALKIVFYVDLRALISTLAPALGTFQFDRLAQFFFPYFAAVGAALGLHQVGEAAGRLAPSRRGVRSLATATVAIAVGAVLVNQSILMNRAREVQREGGHRYATFFERPELAALQKATDGSAPFRVVTFADNNSQSTVNGVTWRYAFETADAYLNLYPRLYHEFWATVIAPTLERREDLRDYFYQWGNRIYLFSPYAQLASRPVFETKQRTFAQVANLDLLALANVKYIVSIEELSDPRLKLWTSGTAGPTASTTSDAPSPALPELRIYENTAWLPRAFVSTERRVLPSLAQVIEEMAAAGAETLRRTVYLDSGSAAGLEPPAAGAIAGGSVNFVRYEADRIELSVDANAPSLLVVTNSYSPHWTATVNGAPQTVRLVDATFQGVAVPAGQSRVILRYDPPWALSGLTLAIALGVVVLAGVGLQRLPLFEIGRIPRMAAVSSAAVIALAAVVSAAWPASPSGPWFDANWGFRQTILVSDRTLTSDVIDIPVLVQRNSDATGFWRNVAADGRDVRFTDGDGKLLPYELEHFDPTQQRMSAWVRLPVIPARRDEVVYLYYGNPAAAADERPAETWDENYQAVWHLDSTRAHDPRIARDSTRHRLDGNVGPATPIVLNGRVGDALGFNGINSSIVVPGAESWEFAKRPWTIEFWIRPAPQKKRNFGLIERGTGDYFSFMVHNLGFLYFERREGMRAANGHWRYAELPSDVWTHVIIRRQGALISAGINGEFAPASEGPADFSDPRLPGPLRIGTSSYGWFEGAFDEIRVSSGVARPPEWLRASYEAQTGRLLKFTKEERRD